MFEGRQPGGAAACDRAVGDRYCPVNAMRRSWHGWSTGTGWSANRRGRDEAVVTVIGPKGSG